MLFESLFDMQAKRSFTGLWATGPNVAAAFEKKLPTASRFERKCTGAELSTKALENKSTTEVACRTG